MSDDGVREINPVQWFDDRDAIPVTKDFRPKSEPATEVEEEPVPQQSRKGPAKD